MRAAMCFYPMSKRRDGDDNWFSLDFDARKRLMGGPRQHITAVAATIDENPSYSENGRITGTVAIVGRTPATTIAFNIAYAKSV